MTWTAEITGDEVCFTLREVHESGNYNSSNQRCVAAARLGSLPRGEEGTFSLRREAGTLDFTGVFTGDRGRGSFEFTADPAFIQALAAEGYGGYGDRELLHFFLSDITAEYLRYLAAENLKPNDEELLQLAVFEIDQKTMSQVLADLRAAGFERPGVAQIVQLRIHGVDREYVRAMAAAGYDGLTLEHLIQARIHDVDPGFVREVSALGFGEVRFEQLLQLAIHGVEGDYVREMQQLGFGELELEDLIRAKIHGVEAATVRNMKERGLEVNDLEEVIRFRIHGVTAEDMAELRALGYTELTSDDFTAAAIHGVSPQFIRSYADLGYGVIPFETLMALRIHDVTPDFIRKNRREGDDLQDMIQARIHGRSRR